MNANTSAFAAHSQVVPLRDILSPRPVLTQPVKLGFNPALRASIDAFADEMLRQERKLAADIAAENQTEGRAFPHRANRNGE